MGMQVCSTAYDMMVQNRTQQPYRLECPMTRHLTIDFVSDISCPWCAVGLSALNKALERVKPGIIATVRFQPFELNPKKWPGGQAITICQCRSCWLIDNSFNIKTSNSTCVFCRLSLSIVKVCWNSNHCFRDFFT
jgi:hypothetical protein